MAEELTAWRRTIHRAAAEVPLERRKVADRFTSAMLIDYAGALGLTPFDLDFFSGPSVLVSNPAPPPRGAVVLSLRDARRWAGINLR